MKRYKIVFVSIFLAISLAGITMLLVSAGATGDKPVPEKQKNNAETDAWSANGEPERPVYVQNAIPVEPPDASKISTSAPSQRGNATITGASGAVPPNSKVLVVNLSSRNVMTATADSQGAFSAYLFAPYGSSIMVKYDVAGDRIVQAWKDFNKVTKPDLTYLTVLPGTMIYAGPGNTSETKQEFNTAGSFVDKSENPAMWGGWFLEGSLHLPPRTAVSQGDYLTFDAQIHLTSPDLNCTEPVSFAPKMHMSFRYLYDQQGHVEPWGVWFTSHIMTPTGLPIEHESDGEYEPMKSATFTSLQCLDRSTIWGTVEDSFYVPATIPDGTYVIEAFIDVPNFPQASGIPLMPVWYHNGSRGTILPITVGTPSPPRIPWMLLINTPLNGHRGVQANQDKSYFAMPNRITFPPEEIVLPMLDERSGQPIRYDLSPGSNWLSSADRRAPNPLKIPFKLPSGGLYASVHKPNGSTDHLGPAPLVQSSVRTPSLPGGDFLDFGTGHITDPYILTTMSEQFMYQFDQYGEHIIQLEGGVDDVYGNHYTILGSYEVTVARILDIDPNQLPSMPYKQGDSFAPGIHIYPPVPADVTVRVVQIPNSDPSQAFTMTVSGTANDFGYFQPSVGTEIKMETKGEYRADIWARYQAPDGTLWAGCVTWGSVIEGPSPIMNAHGMKGMDYQLNEILTGPWFNVLDLPLEQQGIEVYYPYFSGDIHWGDETTNKPVNLGDSIHSIITVEDLAGQDGPVYNLIKGQFSKSTSQFRWPPVDKTYAGLLTRIAANEAPLFFTTNSGKDPGVFPNDIDLWGYWYGSSERPDVHVRDIISEDNMGTAYWRFNDTYGYQIGEPADGDQPGDIKWEFGGAVLRMPSIGFNEYAMYSSFWVLLPHDDPVGARVTAPFRGLGTLNGGPIMTLKGQEIDMLFLPKGVKPGDVLRIGDTISFSGHVGPPLDSKVQVIITSPGGVEYKHTYRANKIGWVYDPAMDFEANEPGRWYVDVYVEHDRPYLPIGMTPTENNTGTVLGTEGAYEFYVVRKYAPNLFLDEPPSGYLNWPTHEIQPIVIHGRVPYGIEKVHYTIHDKGIVMGHGEIRPDFSGLFTFVYAAQELHQDYSMLSLTAREGKWEGLSDEVTISFLAVGSGMARPAIVTLIGEEVFVVSGPDTPFPMLFVPAAFK